MSAKQNPGGVAGRVITELTEQPGGQDIERTMALRSIRNALLKMHHELSREARAILAEVWAKHERMLDLAAEPRPTIEEKQYKVLHTAFTRLGLDLEAEDGGE